ncbi:MULTISPECIES: hypothetical protein [Streptomyces]|uniref:Tetratricopeptide repeat protein n=1 Tax=Streptomyces canarius TaxID=285453 RepID=A0ABQ3DAR8_9ACTN|nr:hypothetical protein [Streptomyces canarius]GHA68379.1 hypothetical protein GCM10010345_85060 [Streptomyces canarius]
MHNALGRDCAAPGRWREAADHHRDALAPAGRTGSTAAESHALAFLGGALLELGETQEALVCLRRALSLGDAADNGALKAARVRLDSLEAG